MSDNVAFTDDDLRLASSGYEVLGPAYFAARRASEAMFEGEDAQPFKDAVVKITEKIREELYAYIENFIKIDLEQNIGWHVRGMVECTVRALLTGDDWALKQYPLSKYHDGQKIREAVAKHCGDSVLTMRVAELEAENRQLRVSLQMARR